VNRCYDTRGRLALVLAVSLVVPACQTWGPTWSEISGERVSRATANRRPAIIERIDDQGAFAGYPIRVEPGMRRILVQGPDLRRPGGGTLQAFDLAVEPCKRYFINAQFDNPIEPTWKPVVDHVEPIAGCLVPAPAK
jgi:hypothetical protein